MPGCGGPGFDGEAGHLGGLGRRPEQESDLGPPAAPTVRCDAAWLATHSAQAPA